MQPIADIPEKVGRVVTAAGKGISEKLGSTASRRRANAVIRWRRDRVLIRNLRRSVAVVDSEKRRAAMTGKLELPRLSTRNFKQDPSINALRFDAAGDVVSRLASDRGRNRPCCRCGNTGP
jgi:hypothetical protein